MQLRASGRLVEQAALAFRVVQQTEVLGAPVAALDIPAVAAVAAVLLWCSGKGDTNEKCVD